MSQKHFVRRAKLSLQSPKDSPPQSNNDAANIAKLIMENENEFHIFNDVKINIKRVPRKFLSNLLILSSTKNFFSIVKLLIKFGARVNQHVIRLTENSGNDNLAELLRIVMKTQILNGTINDIDTVRREFDNYHFDLLCTMFEPQSKRRDDNIIYLLEMGAEPTEYNGAALSRIFSTGYENEEAFHLLVEKLSEKLHKMIVKN